VQVVDVGLADLDTERLDVLGHLFSSSANVVPTRNARHNCGKVLS
jgi:hypothetical protein